MKSMKISIILLMTVMCISSCGSGQAERVKADSSVTSASVGNVQLPDAINTDTTTAAPVPLNDTTAITKSDTQAVNFPDAAKQQDDNTTKTKR